MLVHCTIRAAAFTRQNRVQEVRASRRDRGPDRHFHAFHTKRAYAALSSAWSNVFQTSRALVQPVHYQSKGQCVSLGQADAIVAASSACSVMSTSSPSLALATVMASGQVVRNCGLRARTEIRGAVNALQLDTVLGRRVVHGFAVIAENLRHHEHCTTVIECDLHWRRCYCAPMGPCRSGATRGTCAVAAALVAAATLWSAGLYSRFPTSKLEMDAQRVA